MNAHDRSALDNPERSLLAEILVDDTRLVGIADILKPEHFHNKEFGRLYGVCREMFQEGKRLSLMAIETRFGPEYGEDGLNTRMLLGALQRDGMGQDGSFTQEHAEKIIDRWRRAVMLERMDRAKKDLDKPGVYSDDVLSDAIAALQEIGAESTATPIKTMGELFRGVLSRSKTTKQSGVVPGWDFGLASLDEIMGRMHAGDFGVIGARQGDGKTVIGAQIAMHVSRMTPVVYFQLEMQGEDMASRAGAGEANVSVDEIEEGAWDFEALDRLKMASDALDGLRCFVDARPKLRLDQIRDRCVSLKRSHGLGLAVVDHLRLVRVPGKPMNKFDRIEYVTGELKAMAKDLQIAVIALSQVTRASQRRDDPFPQLTDFDGGSSVEQDADWAMALFRRDEWMKLNKPLDMSEGNREADKWRADYNACKGQIEIGNLKRRRGKAGGRRSFVFLGRQYKIAEMQR